MYEIWLALNILWELAVPMAWPLALAAALSVGAWGWAWRAPAATRRRALRQAAAIGALVAAGAFLLLPWATRSSLLELGYAVDAVVLLAMAFAFGGVAAAIAWPLGVASSRRRVRPGALARQTSSATM